MTTLLCLALEERTFRPETLRAVTSFAVPAKSLKAIEGFAIIIGIRIATSDSLTNVVNNFNYTNTMS